jgi:hypothetical protein
MPRKMIAVKCRISRGGFSGERVVKLTSADGQERIALSPTHYCWNDRREQLQPGEPQTGEIEGWVAAQEVRREPAGVVLITTPDGEAFEVKSGDIGERPPSSEPEHHVPVGSRP